QMHDSLARLSTLPGKTRVYCGHEYTCKNLAFALAVEPDNPAALQQLELAQSAREKGHPTLPSSIEMELEINPFLRCNQESVAQAATRHAGRNLGDPTDILAVLREWKNNF